MYSESDLYTHAFVSKWLVCHRVLRKTVHEDTKTRLVLMALASGTCTRQSLTASSLAEMTGYSRQSIMRVAETGIKDGVIADEYVGKYRLFYLTEEGMRRWLKALGPIKTFMRTLWSEIDGDPQHLLRDAARDLPYSS